MPTLIRLIVILAVLAGLAYGAMFALVTVVDPGEKEVTIRIPARDLMPSQERDPLIRREIDTTRTPDAPPPADAAPTAPADAPATTGEAPAAPAQAPAAGAADGAGGEADVVTLSPGVE